ncbi:hypothetical protein Ocin01_02615 [Orchesella cincta]|uniref:Uncharacterized protein n=1 Tax=Orchesella cincta TaxID=48709 RepID=A0A1D2NFP1_ORCCI|nr:hypothetical protein Ocin01_02615 [Orchesella cincta]
MRKTECLSKHRKWDANTPCQYIINATHFSECSQLKNLNTTEELGSRSPTGILTCVNFPSHFTAVEIWVEGEHISTVLSFEAAESILIKDELTITASVWQHIVTEKDYTNLSKFWANFYFGDCLFRRCWRDLWNVLPEDLLRNFVFQDGDNGSFRWGFFLPVVLLCFVLIVRANLINSTDAEF